MNNLSIRLRRAKKTRFKISILKINRLVVHRTNKHIYAQIFSFKNNNVLVSSSTLDYSVKKKIGNKSYRGGNIFAASIVGECVAKKALFIGIKYVSFDRSGFCYHGRIKALANSARKSGLLF